MKNGIIAWLLVLVFCFMTGCSSQQKQNTVMKIGVLRTADSVPLFVAREDGLYEKYGVNAEIVEFSSASDQAKAVEAGEVDAVMTDLIVQSLMNKGEPQMKEVLIALGETVEQGKFMVVASGKSPYAEKDSIEGAKVAIAEGTMLEFLLDSYCEELGIDLSTIEKVNIPSLSLRLESLMEGGDIDCAVLPDPLAQFAVMQGCTAKIDDTTLKTNFSQSIIAVENTFIQEHRDIVANFVKAYGEAVEHLNNSSDAYRELVLSVARVPEKMQESYVCQTYSKYAVTDEDLLRRVQDWMVQKELLEQPNNYEDLVDASFIK